MKFTAAIASLAAVAAPALAQSTVPVFYNTFYDNGALSLNSVACSNGANGLESKGFTTLGSLPDFPYVGGASAVTAWNSTGCGTCWELTYEGTTITVLAIDTFYQGFDLTQTAFNALTNGQPEPLGKVDATAVQVPASNCGL